MIFVSILIAIRVYKPNITLLSREDGDRIVLECQLNDYFPDNLSVQWLDGEKSVGGQIAKKFQNADKGETKYTYISQLSIRATYEYKKYTCKATHNSEVFMTEYDMCTGKLSIMKKIMNNFQNLISGSLKCLKV